MDNYNRINLPLIGVGGDKDINCNKCPSACCREGMALPLDGAEMQHLENAGTVLEELSFSRRDRRRMGVDRDELVYAFRSDCGNLAVDEVGNMGCRVFGEASPMRPQICIDFVMGGRACAEFQVNRVNRGQDRFVAE